VSHVRKKLLNPHAAAFVGAWLLACTTGLASAATPVASTQVATTVPVPVAVGRALPDVVMSGLNGPARSLASFRGHPLIINVWASWCGPCRAEAASLERLSWSQAGSKYAVIGISTDDERDAALQWLRHSNATISHFLDSRLTLEHMLGASTIPLTVLVDARGRVVSRVRGARQWDTPESIKLIERTFAEAERATTKR
jgi:thiol-disulfide isomerase/thioredoxin